jgi:hypothetical protein
MSTRVSITRREVLKTAAGAVAGNRSHLGEQ